MRAQWFLVLWSAAGCAGANKQWAQARSAGHVPCVSQSIEVVNINTMGTEWVARCAGDDYACTWAATGNTYVIAGAGQVTCSKMAEPFKAPPEPEPKKRKPRDRRDPGYGY